MISSRLWPPQEYGGTDVATDKIFEQRHNGLSHYPLFVV